MNETSRRPNFVGRMTALAALAVALLAAQGCAEAPLSPPSAAEAAAPAGPLWGHELARRTPDPSVRFGRLPNGLRYALQHNETPKDGVAMRLHFGSGSLQVRFRIEHDPVPATTRDAGREERP